MMDYIGKNQTFSRKYNSELILELLRKRSYSATEIAEELSLSNATVSSIIKELEANNIINIDKTVSISGYGRKRVMYEINKNYGFVLSINISNLHAVISLGDMHEKILHSVDLPVKKYDTSAIYMIVLEATQMYMQYNISDSPVRYIVVSLPGRVDSKSGELLLSKQFDKELFGEKHFIQNTLNKQFPNVPVFLINDINLMLEGEVFNGTLANVDNAIYMSIDYGIGGALLINKQLFDGDCGFAGEFGLLKYHHNGEFDAIDEFISLRALIDKASALLNKEVTRDELFELYKTDKRIKELVLDSARILGETISSISDVIGISTFVISGRVNNFKEEYLNEVNKMANKAINKPTVRYSSFGSIAEVIGALHIGVNAIIKQILEDLYEK